MASTEKFEKNKKRNPVLVVASHGEGNGDFMEVFLGFLVALGVLLPIGCGEEEEDTNGSLLPETFFFPHMGLIQGPIGSGVTFSPLQIISSSKLSYVV